MMTAKQSLTFLLVMCFTSILFAQKDQKVKSLSPKKDYLINISTRFGEMSLILFDDTPQHKKNFVKLAQSGFYDSTIFHRVINKFMIQGGDPESKPGGKANMVGRGGPGYTVPAEITGHKHIKGALAAARQGDRVNPTKASSGSQFYIVHNKKGTPHLDGGYTVYGQIISGMEVIDEIASVKVDRRRGNRPIEPIYMKMEVETLSRKKIAKRFDYVYPPTEGELAKPRKKGKQKKKKKNSQK
ncbi:MAG: peptidylprolyl isomerase [Bacteroidota bacterium]